MGKFNLNTFKHSLSFHTHLYTIVASAILKTDYFILFIFKGECQTIQIYDLNSHKLKNVDFSDPNHYNSNAFGCSL